jgi:hypothetical protein
MTKRNAIRLLVATGLVTGGYVAWCARPFLVAEGIQFGPDIPQDARSVITNWSTTTGLPGPRPWSRAVMMQGLMHPWEDGVRPAKVTRIGTAEIWVEHGGRVWCFLLRRGAWGLRGHSDRWLFPTP